jgi:predicted phosphoribosyltransferase
MIISSGDSMGVEMATVVEVNDGVAVGPTNCLGAQLDRAELKSRTIIIAVRCLVFISSPLLSRARPEVACKVSRIIFDWVIVTQQESFVIKNLIGL